MVWREFGIYLERNLRQLLYNLDLRFFFLKEGSVNHKENISKLKYM